MKELLEIYEQQRMGNDVFTFTEWLLDNGYDIVRVYTNTPPHKLIKEGIPSNSGDTTLTHDEWKEIYLPKEK